MTARQIPLVDLHAQHAELRSELDATWKRVVDSGHFILGPEVASFEEELASVCGAKHAVGVSSGTDALLLALMAADIGPGNQVITTPFSFFATAGVIARLGATPVFVDIEEHSFNLDPQAVRSALTDKTRVVLPVNLYGRLAELPSLDEDIVVIEDAAQSIGCGPSRGLAACYSFFPTKNVGALGDAGAVLTEDEAFADHLRLLRTHGGRPKYYHAVVGGNFRIDALQAALLRVKLSRLQSWTQARRDNAQRYRTLLSSCSSVRMPEDSSEHVYHQFTIRGARRDELQGFLRERGIATEVYYPVPLHLQDCFAELGYREGSLPIAEAAARESLSLPIHPHLGAEDLEYVAHAIAEFYGERLA